MSDWERGYSAGFKAGMDAQRQQLTQGDTKLIEDYMRGKSIDSPLFPRKPKRKVRQTPKQKLLTKMTAVKWNKYKKGKGKKTYVEIRAEVSRSQLYKRKVKRL